MVEKIQVDLMRNWGSVSESWCFWHCHTWFQTALKYLTFPVCSFFVAYLPSSLSLLRFTVFKQIINGNFNIPWGENGKREKFPFEFSFAQKFGQGRDKEKTLAVFPRNLLTLIVAFIYSVIDSAHEPFFLLPSAAPLSPIFGRARIFSFFQF